MPPRTAAAPLLPLLLLLLAAGCGKNESPRGTASGAPSASTHAGLDAAASATPLPNLPDALPARTFQTEPPESAYYNETGRLAFCTFVRWSTDRPEKSLFIITAPLGKPVRLVQTQQFYYDARGAQLGTFPSSVVVEGRPQALGYDKDKMPKETASLECEVTHVYFEDGSEWFNENLMVKMARPKGGYSEAQLREHTGERVRATVVDARTGAVTLENVGDKVVEYCMVNVSYFTPQGRRDDRFDSIFKCTIAPGKKLETRISLRGEPLPTTFDAVMATVPEVGFADHTTFTNANLELRHLPRRWHPKSAAARH